MLQVSKYLNVVLSVIRYKVDLTINMWVKPPSVWPFKRKLSPEQYFHVVLLIMFYKEVLTSTSVDETLVCNHSNENYRAILSSGAVCLPVFCKLNFGKFSHHASLLPLRPK